MRDVIVLGAGVVGMTSAYALAREGFNVQVIDAANAAAGGGASFGNGAQLSYSYSDAMASPSLAANLPKYLLGRDPAFRIDLSASPAFLIWGMRFLANATRGRFERNTIDLLKLAMESREGFAELSKKVTFDYRQPGKLNLYATTEALRYAEKLCGLKNRYGAQQVVLGPREAIEREPALAHYGHSFAGALWAPLDEVGNSRLFCENLQRLLEVEHGVKFRFETKVERLKKRRGRIDAVVTDAGDFACENVVLALGTGAVDIARTVGAHLPIWPVQGYSTTIPAGLNAPTASITDTARKIVFCRLGDKLRIAGIADIGNNSEFREARFQSMLQTAKEAFPSAGDFQAELNAWTGWRPVTPNSQPLIGESRIKGLFLNCGHGSLGWTLSIAAANRLAECLRNKPPSLPA
ncbi:FAD-dependent oxidoreductase [Rhizobiaceae bacterium CRRU44]|uniref:FAD-dependent oxidoreductase n=1 Tax=Ferranicluibacter rubi TaxID=2715133 RepID=A0AA44CC91_9HYPH|nr:FAD-dependent oxidoreductase [Ferranicluibacter rubi]NHT77614.1 FAD-dependent oxidoreductase [Ferranicluibacter rubi]